MNRAWEEAEYPRYVSDVLKISDGVEFVFEVSYHYVERKFYVDVIETRVRSDGRRDTYGSMRLFNSLEECFKYIEKKFNVKPVLR